MNYREKERQRATALRDELFRDPGMGDFKKTPREFVLSDPGLNLWGGIRDDALAYFTSNSITWWDSGNEPTGHLLSSQIACINHLYPLRQREDLATVVLRTIRPDILRALPLDTGLAGVCAIRAQTLPDHDEIALGVRSHSGFLLRPRCVGIDLELVPYWCAGRVVPLCLDAPGVRICAVRAVARPGHDEVALGV